MGPLGSPQVSFRVRGPPPLVDLTLHVWKHFHCCFKLQPSLLRELGSPPHLYLLWKPIISISDPRPPPNHIRYRRNGTTCSTSYMYKGRRGISKDPYRRNTEGRSTPPDSTVLLPRRVVVL